MEKLTAKQANELANNFLGLAQAIGDYRYQNSLPKQQNQKIKDLHWSVLNCADDLYTLSATLVMDDVEQSLLAIATITKELQADYKKLQDVQNAINVAASIVTLGSSLFSKNPQAIKESLSNLVSLWKSSLQL